MKGLRVQIMSSMNCNWHSMAELVNQGYITLKRGNVIPKFAYSEDFCYPVYSSSVQNEGLMGYYNRFMFDKEMITWSIDGGGHFFYRKAHKFNITNVCGSIEVDETKFNYRFLCESLIHQHSKLAFDYQTKALPSAIVTMYRIPDTSLSEQIKYATVFDNLYTRLNMEQRLLEQIRLQKAYLLSKMFI